MVQDTRLITADELLHMPDDGRRYELVAGRLREMTPPGFEHGAVVTRLASALVTFVEPRRLGVVVVESGFKLESNPDTVRGPDISFVERERIPSNRVAGYLSGAPDLAVEVRSPGDRRGEIDEKVAQYLQTGARHVWLVEPAHRRVIVHRPGREPQILQEADTLDGGDVVPGFRYPLSQLFAFDV